MKEFNSRENKNKDNGSLQEISGQNKINSTKYATEENLSFLVTWL